MTRRTFKKVIPIILGGGLALIALFFYFLWPKIDDRIVVTDPASGIAGARLFKLRENGHLKHSDADWVLPLNNPEWRASSEADHMKRDDPVLGLYRHGNSWAIPWWIIKNHHVANVTLNGEPVLIGFCEACSTGIAFDPLVNGRLLTFRLVGTYNGSILIADYETNSYWTPLTGEALDGPLKGTRLKQTELILCRWSEWLELHPQSLVAYGSEELRKGHSFDKTPGRADKTFLYLLLKPLDVRLPFNDLILGVTVGSEARAYSLLALDTGPDRAEKNIVVNDIVGGDEIVILHKRKSWLAAAFSRRLGGQTLRFGLDRDGRFIDSMHHSHWSYEGEAVDGPAAGQKLPYVTSRVEDWYVWAAFHPKTSIFGKAPGEND
jgi:hypothetical protein